MGVQIFGNPIFIGKPVISGTSGSLLYVDASGNLAEDNSNLFYDATNKRIGIGTAAPGAKLELETDSATEVGLIIMTAASQSADALQVVNSSGIEMLSLDEDGHIRFWEGQSYSFGNKTYHAIRIGGTLTFNNAGSALIGFLCDSAITYTAAPILGVMPTFFSFAPTITMQSAATLLGLGSFFNHGATYVADGVAIGSLALQISYFDNPTINIANAGTWSSSSAYTAFQSSFVVGSGTTWGTRTAFNVADATGSGSIVTQVGFNVASFAKGTTNISIRAQGTTGSCRFVPKTKFGADSVPNVNVDINGAIAVSKATVSLTADNQTVTTADRSYISLSSDNATAGNRTFILAQSTVAGQILTLEWTGTNAAELIDDSAQGTAGNHRMSATWTPTQYDTITFISNGTDWVEIARSTN